MNNLPVCYITNLGIARVNGKQVVGLGARLEQASQLQQKRAHVVHLRLCNAVVLLPSLLLHLWGVCATVTRS